MTHQGKEEKESLKGSLQLFRGRSSIETERSINIVVLDTFLSPSRNWKTRDPSVDTKCLQPIEYSNVQ
jgi:hypothetical protein